MLLFLRAALTDSFFSSGMCFGRLMSIWLATVLLPSSLLVICMLSCLLGTVLLIFLAPLYSSSLYSGVAIMGFFVSWQFGTGFSWTSQHMNITGRISSIFFIGWIDMRTCCSAWSRLMLTTKIGFNQHHPTTHLPQPHHKL